MINNKSMYLDMLLRGIDARGNHILVVNHFFGLYVACNISVSSHTHRH